MGLTFVYCRRDNGEAHVQPPSSCAQNRCCYVDTPVSHISPGWQKKLLIRALRKLASFHCSWQVRCNPFAISALEPDAELEPSTLYSTYIFFLMCVTIPRLCHLGNLCGQRSEIHTRPQYHREEEEGHHTPRKWEAKNSCFTSAGNNSSD